MYEVLSLAGADVPLGEWVTGLTRDHARFVLLLVLGVTPFAESVTGFGVGVVIATPLLVQRGFPPERSAALALLGLVAVPWGALGPGTLVASRLTGVPLTSLGVESALLSLPVFLTMGFAALLVGVGRRAAVARLDELLLVALALWIGIATANRWAGTPLAGVLGSLAGIGMVLVLVHAREGPLARAGRRLPRSALPYALLVGLLLFSHTADGVFPRSDAPSAATLHALWLNPATWLVVTAAATPLLLADRRPLFATALRRAILRWWPVALTTVAFLALGALMTAAGMAAAIAGLGSRVGRGYLLLAPWLGGLGGFLTGSNVGANAMFVTAQLEAARHLGYPEARMVAVQNVCGSLLTMASAPRVALALSLLDHRDRDPEIVRTVVAADAVALVFLSILSAVLGRQTVVRP